MNAKDSNFRESNKTKVICFHLTNIPRYPCAKLPLKNWFPEHIKRCDALSALIVNRGSTIQSLYCTPIGPYVIEHFLTGRFQKFSANILSRKNSPNSCLSVISSGKRI